MGDLIRREDALAVVLLGGSPVGMSNRIAALPAVTVPVVSPPVRYCPICDIADCATHRPVAAPDPAEAKVAALREALTLAANRLHRCSVDYDTGSLKFIETGEWAEEARAALKGTDHE